MNVTSVFTRIKNLFGDQNSTQITEAMVILWINDAQREAAMQHENLLPTVSFISTVADTADYALPSDLLALRHVSYKSDTDYYPLKFVTVQQLNEHIGNWYTGVAHDNGVPTLWTREKNGFIRIFPEPNTVITDGIKLFYSRYPVDVTVGGSLIDLPAYYDSYVEHYCMLKAYELDENWEASDRKAQLVQNTLDFNNNRDAWFAQGEYPSVSPTWDDAQ